MTTTPDAPDPDRQASPDPVAPGSTPGADGAEQAVAADVAQDVLAEAADVLDDAAERELQPQEAAAMDALDTPRRLLLVHAHPDDETIGTGATMALYAGRPDTSVTLVTCTRGERGEVIGDELASLEGDEDALAEHRVQELAAAMEALGVSDHRFLGSDAVDADGHPTPVRYRDSGMVWVSATGGGGDADEAPGASGTAQAPPDVRPDALSAAPLEEEAEHLARVLREVRPQVVITYGPGGGYGHPDHVRAHDLTLRACDLAADGGSAPWSVAKVLAIAVPEDELRDQLRELRVRGLPTLDPEGPLPELAVPREEVTTVVDASAELPAKTAALRAHATQVILTEGSLAMSNGLHQPLTGVESYRLLRGGPEPVAGEVETDLFQGLT